MNYLGCKASLADLIRILDNRGVKLYYCYRLVCVNDILSIHKDPNNVLKVPNNHVSSSNPCSLKMMFRHGQLVSSSIQGRKSRIEKYISKHLSSQFILMKLAYNPFPTKYEPGIDGAKTYLLTSNCCLALCAG